MTREELATASELLAEAAADIDDSDVRQRTERQAETLSRLAEADRGPDHGRLARIERALGKIIEATDSDAVREALDRVRAYRETVSGV